MARLIDADALLKQAYYEDEELVVDVWDIENAPTVDAVPVVHARWILNEDGSATCTNCRRHTKGCWDDDSYYRYCPDCGAIMGLEVE